MRVMGLYDVAAILVGVPLTVLVFAVALGSDMDWQSWISPYLVFVAVFSNWFTARLFRDKIRETKGWTNLSVAIGIGLYNVVIFSFLATGPGVVYGMFYALRVAYLIVPLSILAHYLMKAVDRRYPSRRITIA